MKEPKKTPDDLRAIVLVGQLGFTIAAPVVLGALAGLFVEQRYGWGPWPIIVFTLVGVAVGIVGGYRTIRPFLG